LRWLNKIRPKEQPEVTELQLTAERLADETTKAFRQRVEWWGGGA